MAAASRGLCFTEPSSRVPAYLTLLRHNADAEAIVLTLPLLRDANSIVRDRAFTVLQTLTGQTFLQNDPAKWEHWWAASKVTFVPRKPDSQ